MNMHNVGGSVPPRTTMLEFLTVTTGHTMSMSRAGMADDVIERLRPIVLAGRGHILGWDIQMVRGAAGGAAGFTLKRDGYFLTCSYVAWTEEGAAEFWPVIQQVAKSGFGAAVTERPERLPWLAAVIMPFAPEAIPLLSDVASLERYLAWTILETLGGGKPTAPSEAGDFDGVQDIGAGIAAFVQGTDAGTSGVRLPQDGATLSIGPDGLTMYVQLADPTKTEVADLRRGKLDIGILSVGGTGIALTRFGAAADTPRFPAKPPIIFDCPFHIGLLPPHRRHLPQRAGGLSLALTIVVQDQYGKQHGARHLGLAIPTAEAIERIVAKQANEAARLGWTRASHDAEVARFYGQTPDLGRAADRLFAKAWARETVQ